MLFIALIGVALIILVGSSVIHIQILDGVLALLTLCVAMVAFLTKNYLYLFDSIVKKKGKDLVVSSTEAFAFSSSGNAIIRREKGDNVYASCFIKIPIYKSATEMTKEEKTNLAKLFGRVLALSKVPMKLSAQLYVVNKDEYITKLRNTLNEAEEKYREAQSFGIDEKLANMERARGRVTMWRDLLNNVSSSQSKALALYAMVSALGGNDEEAANIAYQKAEELAGGISATLGVNASVASGNEILTFIEPDYMIPRETVTERIMQKSMGEN
jgi:hypothetical protein